MNRLPYDTPIQVTKQQYQKAMTDCPGMVAGREANGQYFIKVWFTKYSDKIRKAIK